MTLSSYERFLRHVRRANQHDLSGFWPFRLASQCIGWLRPHFAQQLRQWPHIYRLDAHGVALSRDLEHASCAERSAALAPTITALYEQGHIQHWRDERYPVCGQSLDQPPRLLLERGAAVHFGVRGFGVHINGYVRRPDGLHLWVARRADDRPNDPGKLDQIAAGGQPAGIDVYQNARKECAEEAGIGPELSQRLRPVGIIGYCMENALGLRPDLIYCFDLELPSTFTPRNTDGEVAAFELWPLAHVAEVVRETDDFKFNCNLVIIDFLARHGMLRPDQPGYATLIGELRAGWRFPEP